MTTQNFIIRYDNKEHFSEEELQDMFWGDFDDAYLEPIEIIEGDHHRWNYTSSRIYKIEDNRYFEFSAFLALTEMQENYYDTQPVEVQPVKQTIIVTEWEAV